MAASGAANGDAAGEESYAIDWRAQPRQPFRRGFCAYVCEDAEAVAERRRALGVDVIQDPAGADATPSPVESFEELGVLPFWLLGALHSQEVYEPTALQAQSLPITLAGQNLVGIARPGSGQDVAYMTHAAVHAEEQAPLKPDDPGPIALILVPTQEAAAKVAEQAGRLLSQSQRSARHKGLRCVNMSGGGTRSEKLKEFTLSGSHLVVGTPKRILDIASKEQMSLLRVTLLVLDGADRMVDLGFAGEVKQLASWTRPERQTLIFGGTWPRALAEMANELCFPGGAPVHIAVSATAPRGAKRAAEEAPQAAKKPANGAKPGLQAAAKAKPAQGGSAPEDPEEFPEDW